MNNDNALNKLTDNALNGEDEEGLAEVLEEHELYEAALLRVLMIL